MEEKGLIPAETMRDLKSWWREKLSEKSAGKVVTMPWIEQGGNK